MRPSAVPPLPDPRPPPRAGGALSPARAVRVIVPACADTRRWRRLPWSLAQTCGVRFELAAAGELGPVLPTGTCFLYSRSRVGDLRSAEEYVGSQSEDPVGMRRVRGLGLITAGHGDVVAVHDRENAQAGHAARNAELFRRELGRHADPAERATVPLDLLAAWRAPALPGVP